ncbi:hypothetical protein NHX12_004682 [Muraenolepis orangiensis]|uniref:Uncharacterized protein n=1 Tax=Muraenolepis orangiensis TaxID=630683 RepID=A0A9Q0IEU1_9TELE|nr:hypothetical protein NHX12_004682 [Muraenolepis orangiensis]
MKEEKKEEIKEGKNEVMKVVMKEAIKDVMKERRSSRETLLTVLCPQPHRSFSLAITSLIPLRFSPPPLSSVLRRIGAHSRQPMPVQEVERRGLRKRRDHGHTFPGENRLTIARGILSGLSEKGFRGGFEASQGFWLAGKRPGR